MRIAQLAPLTESVPPKTYGGTELVVTLLTEELVKRGHQVTLFASGDSSTEAELVKCSPAALRLDGVPPHRWAAYEMSAVLKLLERKGDFDVVHNHMGYIPFPFLEQLDCPSVTTIHNGISSHLVDIFMAYRHLPFIAISDAYRRLNYGDIINYVGRVYNGIDTASFATCKGTTNGATENTEDEFLLFVGRISHAKGTAEAITIAKALGKHLKIAGKVDHADTEYFHSQVEPFLNDDDIKYIGEIDHTQKVELYHQAKAVLCPINFDEPFGLVFAEALASGTPVMALDRGSAREVLSDGETAIVGSTTDELIERFPEVEKLTREACVRRAISLFDTKRMADDYEKVYQQVADRFHAREVQLTH